MRVISQDRTIDVPYENFVFGITLDNYISAVMDTAVRPIEVVNGIMAKYSSREKALKVMELLRESYLKFAHATNNDSFYTFFDNPKVFQFPADDEVKV
jgi:hypothetical protein|nr:MAG TPA: hypothetical protein [Bacteriophage sp.]